MLEGWASAELRCASPREKARNLALRASRFGSTRQRRAIAIK
jgi:hypothetical protein